VPRAGTPALARWLERRSNPDAAQELLAETFAQAWIARRRYRPGRGPVRAWLFGIAPHLLFGYRRLDVEDRARRRVGVSLEPYVVEDADERLDAAALGPELARQPDPPHHRKRAVMTIEANVRAALMPALERDLRRRRPRRAVVAVALLIAATATTGVAAATGVIFAPPKPDHTVPAVPEWTHYAHDPYGVREGPVSMRGSGWLRVARGGAARFLE
jgi:DNA-directed RNA polymerase specialized sigma24 family protein